MSFIIQKVSSFFRPNDRREGSSKVNAEKEVLRVSRDFFVRFFFRFQKITDNNIYWLNLVLSLPKFENFTISEIIDHINLDENSFNEQKSKEECLRAFENFKEFLFENKTLLEPLHDVYNDTLNFRENIKNCYLNIGIVLNANWSVAVSDREQNIATYVAKMGTRLLEGSNTGQSNAPGLENRITVTSFDEIN